MLHFFADMCWCDKQAKKSSDKACFVVCCIYQRKQKLFRFFITHLGTFLQTLYNFCEEQTEKWDSRCKVLSSPNMVFQETKDTECQGFRLNLCKRSSMIVR